MGRRNVVSDDGKDGGEGNIGLRMPRRWASRWATDEDGSSMMERRQR